MPLNNHIQYYEARIKHFDELIQDIRFSQDMIDWLVSQRNHHIEMQELLSELQVLRAKVSKANDKVDNYQEWTLAYFDFYESRIGVKPRFGAAEGKALKDIAKYLGEVIKDNQPIEAWRFILANWSKLTPFIANQCTPLGINKNINEILSQLKYGSTKSANNVATKQQQARDVLANFQ